MALAGAKETLRGKDLMFWPDSKVKHKLYPGANDKWIWLLTHQDLNPDVNIIKNPPGEEAIAYLDVGEKSSVQCCVVPYS